MALSNAIMKYVGNELAQTGQKSLTKAATGAATSGLLSALTQAAPKAATKSVVNSIIPVTQAASVAQDIPVIKDPKTLYRGLTQEYDPNYPTARLDTSGYESFTDNPMLAKQYGDNVYSITVPEKDIKTSYLDENPNSPTYGDRNPIYSIDKKAGLNGVSGKEYLLEVGSPLQKSISYNKVQDLDKAVQNYLGTPTVAEPGMTWQQEQYFKNSKLRDDQGNLIKVYHSTPEDFAKFDDKKLGANTGYENTAYGHFVTPDREFSELGSFNKEGVPTTIKEMYANVQNPIVHPSNADLKYSGEDLDNIVKSWFEAIDDPYTLAEITDAAQANGTSLYDEYENLFDLGSDSPFINAGDERKALMEKGYDAVEMVEGLKRDLIRRGEDASPVSSYAIFNSNQLKDINNRMPIASPFQSGEYDQNQVIRRIFSDDSYERLRESPVIDQLGPLQLDAYKAAQEGSLFSEDFLKNDPFYTDLQDKMIEANNNKYITHDMEDNPDLIPMEKLQELQNISKDFIRNNIKGVGQDRKAVIVVGRPSSGKSSGAVNQYSVKKKAKNGGDFFELDNDDIKKLIPGYDNGIGASAVQEASSLIGKKMVLPELTQGGYNIVLPIVGQKEKSLMEYVDTLANAGYEIGLVNTVLPVDSCRTRNRTRSYETGRGVPDDYIVRVGNRPDEVYNKIVNDIKNGKERRISSYAAVSTDVAFGEPARVIENSGSELLARLNN